MVRSKEHICPNTGMSVWVEYRPQRLMVRDPDEQYPMYLPFGLLVRVLEKEPRLWKLIAEELQSTLDLPALSKALDAASYPEGDPTNAVELMQWLETHVGIKCHWRHDSEPDWSELWYESASEARK